VRIILTARAASTKDIDCGPCAGHAVPESCRGRTARREVGEVGPEAGSRVESMKITHRTTCRISGDGRGRRQPKRHPPKRTAKSQTKKREPALQYDPETCRTQPIAPRRTSDSHAAKHPTQKSQQRPCTHPARHGCPRRGTASAPPPRSPLGTAAAGLQRPPRAKAGRPPRSRPRRRGRRRVRR
jgi:hypothetical protein